MQHQVHGNNEQVRFIMDCDELDAGQWTCADERKYQLAKRYQGYYLAGRGGCRLLSRFRKKEKDCLIAECIGEQHESKRVYYAGSKREYAIDRMWSRTY